MHVRSLTASLDRRNREYADATAEDFAEVAQDPKYMRLAFVGRMPQGLAGVALDLTALRVRGHKLDPIPQELLAHVTHFPLRDMRQALQMASTGVDVLAGDTTHGFMIRWNGPAFEIFAAGEDSEDLGSIAGTPLPH